MDYLIGYDHVFHKLHISKWPFEVIKKRQSNKKLMVQTPID